MYESNLSCSRDTSHVQAHRFRQCLPLCTRHRSGDEKEVGLHLKSDIPRHKGPTLLFCRNSRNITDIVWDKSFEKHCSRQVVGGWKWFGGQADKIRPSLVALLASPGFAKLGIQFCKPLGAVSGRIWRWVGGAIGKIRPSWHARSASPGFAKPGV